jgi:hypothetical protein
MAVPTGRSGVSPQQKQMRSASGVGLLSPAEERFLATLRQTLAVYDQSYGFGFSTYVVRTDDDYAGSCSPEPINAIVDSRSATTAPLSTAPG